MCMSTYRYGSWIVTNTMANDYGVRFYSIDKKTFFGWKEIHWWKNNEEGQRHMMDAVNQLKGQGHLVLHRT